MCGIAGYWARNTESPESLHLLVERMANSLIHRGPDDTGTWADAAAGFALGHRRLAVLDLSSAGHQPMESTCGRFVIAFNGEVYNHLDLRRELEASVAAPTWRGHSDTETLLAAIEHWGVEPTLKRAVGMFAVALWDRSDRTLTLARDRYGEKPLYYGWIGRGEGSAFLFGSELKALRAVSGFDAPVCREALAQYLRFLYVPAPRSIFRGVFKLEPGCLLTVRGLPPTSAPSDPLRPGGTHGNVSVRRWWALADVIEAGDSEPITDEAEALHLLEERLKGAVRRQSSADVPLGAFLSGGVDSSTIVALMQDQSKIEGRSRTKTFTIGFDQPGFDEAPYARKVADHLGTDHHEMRVTAQHARDVISALPHIYDEPFADSSQIPTHLICSAARQHVTVALSGDAGDEIFGGYNRYLLGPRLWHKLKWLPFPARRALGTMIAALPTQSWATIGTRLSLNISPATADRLGEKLRKLAVRLETARDIDSLYRNIVSEWQDPTAVVKGRAGEVAVEPSNLLDDALPAHGVDDEQLRMMYRDSMTYLPDDILCKVDRAAMATGLETRVPFLDNSVVELAWRLPLRMKIRGNQGKWALRQILYKYVPRELIERPKAGFAVPIGQWLRGPLRDWAEQLLDESRLMAEGYFHPQPIRERWSEHLSGRHDHTPSLWGILMFQAWLEANT